MVKNILIVIPYFIPARSYGGPVKVAYDHAIGLIKKGYSVTVLTTDAFDAYKRIQEKEEVIDGIKIYRCRNISNYLAKWYNFYLPINFTKQLITIIKKHKVSTIHIHDVYTWPTIQTARIANKLQIPYVIQTHGTLSPKRISLKNGVLKRLTLHMTRNLFNKANRILALTKTETGEIKEYYPNANISLLANGINLRESRHIIPFDFHKHYKLSKQTKIFSFLGRIQFIKGLDRAIEILFEFNKSNQNRIFVIIGPDEGEKEKLIRLTKQKGIQEKVKRRGMEKGKKKYELIAGSDLLIFTSRSEGFPMTCLEYAACGTPVLISKEIPLPELEKNGWGRIIDADNIKKSSKILNKLTKIGKNGFKNLRKSVKELYSIEKINEKLLKVYSSISQQGLD